MTKIKQGEIWVVNLNESSDDTQKLINVVVLNDDRLGRFAVKMVAPIIKWEDKYKRYPWIVKILSDDSNMLEITSSIECYNILKLPNKCFVEQKGKISAESLITIHETMLKTLNPSYKIEIPEA